MKKLLLVLPMLLVSAQAQAGWGKMIRGAAYVGTGIYAVNKLSGSADKHTDAKNGVSEDERECRKMVKQHSYTDKSLKRNAYCCKQIENPSEKCNDYLDKLYSM